MNEEPRPETVPPEHVDQMFDIADLLARVENFERSQDTHRKELLLMWVTLCLIAGVLTYGTWTRLRENLNA